MKNKIDRMCAIIGSAIMLFHVSLFNADAVYRVTNDVPLSPPEGYTEFSVNYNSGVVRYQNIERTLENIKYSNFKYNIIKLTLADETDSAAVYEKYMSDLGFDVVSTANGLYAYDEYESGTDPRAFDNKYKQIMIACTDMYDDGILLEATYNIARAEYNTEEYTKSIRISNFPGTENELRDIAIKYADYVSVKEYSDGWYVSVTNLSEDASVYDAETLSYSDLNAISNEIDALYGDDSVGMIISTPASGEEFTTTPINLLTAIQEEDSCDINQSGAPDLDDAVLVLTSYANTAAGIETASETDTVSYDVNGDGAVDLDDAVKILTVYSEMAAGLR